MENINITNKNIRKIVISTFFFKKKENINRIKGYAAFHENMNRKVSSSHMIMKFLKDEGFFWRQLS